MTKPEITPRRNVCKHNWISIVYGYPTESMCKQANANEIKIGGCIVHDDSPTLFCTKCEEYK